MNMPLPPGIKPHNLVPDDRPNYNVKVGQMKASVPPETVDQIMIRTLGIRYADDYNIKAFIKRYLECCHPAQAARDIGLKGSQGKYILGIYEVADCIKQIRETAFHKYGFDADEVVERAKEIAFVDPVELENEDGSYKARLSQMSPELRRSIKKMKVKNIYEKDPNGFETKFKEAEIVEIEFWSKEKMLELLGREKELFKESKKVTHDVASNMQTLLLESRQRAAERVDAIDVTPKKVEGDKE